MAEGLDHPPKPHTRHQFSSRLLRPTGGRRVYDRSFRNKHLAEEYARKLELHVNGAGPSPDLGGAVPTRPSPTTCSRLPWTEAVDGWLERSANGYNESFNGKSRDELLNGELFTSLTGAEVVTEDYRLQYDHSRPHSSLAYVTAFAAAERPGSDELPAGPFSPALSAAEYQETLITTGP